MKSILKITLIFILYSCFLLCQTAGYDVNVNKGSTTVLTWKAPGDYSGYDSLYFAVKPCTTSNSCGRLADVSKSCGVSYSTPYTTVVCTLYAANTSGLNAAKYYYSIYAYGADTVAVRSGLFNLQLNGQSAADGVATTGPVHILAVDSTTLEPGIPIFYNSDNSQSYVSYEGLLDSIGAVDSLSAHLNKLDSLFTKTSHIVKVEEYIGAYDTSAGWSLVIQAAIDDNLGSGKSIIFSSNYVYDLQTQGTHTIFNGHKYCVELTSNTSLIIPQNTILRLKDNQQTSVAVDIIIGQGLSNIYIGGGGKILGNTAGQTGWTGGYAQGTSGDIILITHSNNVTIEDLELADHFSNPTNIQHCYKVTYNNCLSWGVGEGPGIEFSSAVFVTNNIHHDSTNVANGDGFEIAHCDNVFMSNNLAKQQDIGAGFDLFECERLTATNCNAEDFLQGVTLQTYSRPDTGYTNLYSNFYFRNCGTAIMGVDNGVKFSNGEIKYSDGYNAQNPFAIKVETAGDNFAGQPVEFNGITIDSCDENGVYIQGSREVNFYACKFHTIQKTLYIEKSGANGTANPKIGIFNCEFISDSNNVISIHSQADTSYAPTINIIGSILDSRNNATGTSRIPIYTDNVQATASIWSKLRNVELVNCITKNATVSYDTNCIGSFSKYYTQGTVTSLRNATKNQKLEINFANTLQVRSSSNIKLIGNETSQFEVGDKLDLEYSGNNFYEVNRSYHPSSGVGNRTIIADGWYDDDVEANQTTVALLRGGSAMTQRFYFKKTNQVYIRKLGVVSNEVVTAGTLTITLYANGSATSRTVTLTTAQSSNTTEYGRLSGWFNLGGLGYIDLRITTSNDWSPTTADIIAWVELEY